MLCHHQHILNAVPFSSSHFSLLHCVFVNKQEVLNCVVKQCDLCRYVAQPPQGVTLDKSVKLVAIYNCTDLVDCWQNLRGAFGTTF